MGAEKQVDGHLWSDTFEGRILVAAQGHLNLARGACSIREVDNGWQVEVAWSDLRHAIVLLHLGRPAQP